MNFNIDRSGLHFQRYGDEQKKQSECLPIDVSLQGLYRFSRRRFRNVRGRWLEQDPQAVLDVS